MVSFTGPVGRSSCKLLVSSLGTNFLNVPCMIGTYYVCAKVKSLMEVKGEMVGNCIAVLATGTDGTDYRTIGHLFGVPKATVCIMNPWLSADYMAANYYPSIVFLAAY